MRYRVGLILSAEYEVEANSEDEAVDLAIEDVDNYLSLNYEETNFCEEIKDD